MAGSASKGSRTPLQKNLSRRVSFNEATLTKAQDRPKPPSDHYDSSDTESQSEGRPRRGCLSLCNSCCAWISLIIGILLILFLLLGGIYFAFLQSNLPEVRLQRLDVYRVDVYNTDKDTVVVADIEVRLNTTNGSGKIELGYSSMTASISSAGVDFGEVKLAGMRQHPHTTTDLKVRPAMKKLSVEEAAAKELQDNARIHMLVVDVVVKGEIDFFVGGKRMNGFPFKIDCHSIDQSEIDDGHAPKCNTKMTPLQVRNLKIKLKIRVQGMKI
ncbi:hypothetical protein Pfo_018401 [Paulownia fortunei]|nr:hypothetical protein Pfo_018401 [Paulownia fortunei]